MQKSKILKELYASKTPIKILLELKSLPYNESRKKIKQALEHPYVRALLVKNSLSLPKSYSDLRKGKTLPHIENLAGELAYYVQDLINHSAKLNRFFDLEGEHSDLIFKGNWFEAEKMISKIENEICYSYWGIENRISNYEMSDGTEGNWKFLKEINEVSELPYSLLLQSLFSKKAESDNSVFQYKKDIENVIKNFANVEMQYVLFKSGYFLADSYSEYSYILHIESLSPIIDKYLFLVDLLVEIQTKDEYKNLVLEVVNDLELNGINDSRLLRIREKLELNFGYHFSVKIVSAIDFYSSGNYDEFLAFCEKFAIEEGVLPVEILNLYVKSLIELNSDFKELMIGGLWNNLTKDLYNIYQRNEFYNESRENILKYYLLFTKDKKAKQLLSLVSAITGLKNSSHALSSYFNSFSETSILFQCDYLNINDVQLQNSLSVKIQQAVLNNDFSGISINLPEIKLLIYKSRAKKHRNIKIDIRALEEKLYSNYVSNISREELFKLVYDFYIDEDNFYEAIKVYVNIYFKNKFLVERIEPRVLLNKIVDQNYTISKISLELPIYFHLEDADNYYKYVALDLYLNSIEVDRPSNLSNGEIKLSELEVFMLEEVCNVSVLNNFYLIFSTDNEVIEERIEILKLLSRNDSSSQEKYLEEIATLTQKIKIKEYLENSNDGKINLNFTRIREDKVYNLENSYNRFIKLNEYTQKNELKLLDATETVSSFLSEVKVDSSKLMDASYLSFKILFFEVVNHFLFSKEHGLDGDLSTRIRHGVLENQIRSVFMDKSLIANRNSEEKYNNIEKFDIYLRENNFDNNTIHKVQQAIKKFSKSIDDQIQEIVKDLIQIQSNNNRNKPKALFNYNFAEEYLYVMFRAISSEIETYEEFLNTCFDSLKNHTVILLQQISEFFRLDVTVKVHELLNELKDDLGAILPENDELLSKINQDINQSSAIIQREIYSIADWFKLSNNLEKTVLDFETIIQIAVESINLYSKKVSPNVSVNTSILFQNSLYYVDLLKIMLENAIKHSNLGTQDLVVDITVDSNEKEKDGMSFSNVVIIVENNLSPAITGLDNKLIQVKQGWNSGLESVNVEGGSGFQKIKRILQYDLKALENNFDFEINEDKLKLILSYTNRIWWKDD